MKKLLTILFVALFLASCGGDEEPTDTTRAQQKT